MTERYRAMTRRRRLLAAIWAGVGATILILLLVSGGRGLPRYLDSFLFGTGAATLASGMVNFFRKNDLLRDETRLRKAAIVELDERNLEITRRACALTLDILLIVMYAAMVVSAFFSWTVCFTLLAALCVNLLAMLICFIVVAKNL